MKHFEVVAAIIIKENRVFCAQRKDVGETAKKWEFPGGKIESGETPEKALSREIFEELTLTIDVGDFLITINHEYKTFSITMHAYECSIVAGSITLLEHLDYKWLTKDDLFTVDWAPADIPIVEQVRDMLDF